MKVIFEKGEIVKIRGPLFEEEDAFSPCHGDYFSTHKGIVIKQDNQYSVEVIIACRKYWVQPQQCIRINKKKILKFLGYGNFDIIHGITDLCTVYDPKYKHKFYIKDIK